MEFYEVPCGQAGTVVVRFEPTGDMNELERQILALL